MKKNILLVIIFFASLTFAQVDSSSVVNTPKHKTGMSRATYGGGIGFSYTSNYISGSFRPHLGYRFTNKFSTGLQLMYEYVSDSRWGSTKTYSNYGGSIYGKYYIISSLFVRAEYAMYNYEYRTSSSGEREWIPFLLLGAGYSQRIGHNTRAYAQVMWDVLQDSRSPYKSGEPRVSFGVTSGF